jgi:hypothetical protein
MMGYERRETLVAFGEKNVATETEEDEQEGGTLEAEWAKFEAGDDSDATGENPEVDGASAPADFAAMSSDEFALFVQAEKDRLAGEADAAEEAALVVEPDTTDYSALSDEAFAAVVIAAKVGV